MLWGNRRVIDTSAYNLCEILLVLFHSGGPVERRSALQKWEYLTVKVETFGFNNQQVAAKIANDQEIRDWKQTSLGRYIHQLGEQGWEMIGTIVVPGVFGAYLFFKPPKP
jgi:hypothetical protein